MNRYFVSTITIGVLTILFSLAHPQRDVLSSNTNASHDDANVTDSIARADSIANALVQEKVTKVAESYKHLKFVQYDGVTEANLYPSVMEVHQSVMDVIDNKRITSDDNTKLKSILLDLDPLLMKGAVFYSSEGNSAKMNEFAKACVDTRMRPDMATFPFSKQNNHIYPSLVYCAASSAYNSGNYKDAINYFEEYLATGAQEQREKVAMFLGQACINAKCPEKGIDRLIEATNAYPTNYNLLMITLQNCLNADEGEKMTPLMERALLMRPDDEQLLNVQAALYENQGNFTGALDLYSRLYELHPTSLDINKHLALCYYNLGADCYNRSLTDDNEKNSKRLMRQAKAYMQSACTKLEAVVESSPSDIKYLKALAMTYGTLGDAENLAEINTRLSALGIKPVTITGMPESITYDDSATSGNSGSRVPDFQDFARSYVEKNLAEWTKRKEFEKKEDFEKRVSQNNVYLEYTRLCKEAEADYLKKYAKKIRISDLTLEPYDIDHESYMINSDMGPIVVKVPLKNKEAETFKSQWSSVQLRNPKYFIKDNKLAIASVDLVVPNGKTYSYNSDAAANYDFTDVNVDVASFIAQGNAARERQSGNVAQQRSGGSSSSSVIRAKSDVDKDIPVTSRKADKTVALVWANENYKNVTPVASALNDGETFVQYCKQTLGVPESQIIFMPDLTYAEMIGSVKKLRQLVNALGDGVDIIFYYAGHGIPDEATKDSFLLPTDGDGMMTAVSYQLKQLYHDLSSMRADNVMVFLDACFSGATRDGGMLAEARGVALKPKATAPDGNMFVLSAASDQETALPYKEKNHGLFTYFLLKKLQESKGNVSLKDLSDYVKENVKISSLKVNGKSQTPSVQVSGDLSKTWTSKKMRP